MSMIVEATFSGGVLVPKTPLDLVEGDEVEVVVRKASLTARGSSLARDLPRHDVPWPFGDDESFRREDLYDDDGR